MKETEIGKKILTTEEIHALVEQKKTERLARQFSKKINASQGFHIKCQLKCAGLSNLKIAQSVGCSPQAVSSVLFGKSHSQRIEKAVATALGYRSWNDMVQELRNKEQAA